MKKLICVLTLLLMTTLALTPAFAYTEADEYLVDKVWEMNVGDWGNTEYIFFGRDGYGFWARRYETGYAKMYYFYWHTWSEGSALSTYIQIDFGSQEEPVNGWSLYNNPHQQGRYQLLWNPDFMFMIDHEHTGTDIRSTDSRRDLHIFNGQYPAPYLIEKYTNECNAFFQ